jgi:8-oxo-dGTP pyrophosphatase MutT (NUDIX family)
MRLHLFSMRPKNAGVLLFQRTREGTRVCIVQESNSGKWNIPSGGINPREDATRAATRELFEESSRVLNFNPNGVYNTIQIGSFHLVLIETSGKCWSDSTKEFETKRSRNNLGQNETTDLMWVFVPELYEMRSNNKLRGCFASLLGCKDIRAITKDIQ